MNNRELEDYFSLFSRKRFKCFCIKERVNSRFFLFLLRHPEGQLALQEDKRRVILCECKYKHLL